MSHADLMRAVAIADHAAVLMEAATGGSNAALVGFLLGLTDEAAGKLFDVAEPQLTQFLGGDMGAAFMAGIAYGVAGERVKAVA